MIYLSAFQINKKEKEACCDSNLFAVLFSQAAKEFIEVHFAAALVVPDDFPLITSTTLVTYLCHSSTIMASLL